MLSFRNLASSSAVCLGYLCLARGDRYSFRGLQKLWTVPERSTQLLAADKYLARSTKSHPASRLKLYIQDVEAALKTLHHIRWYSLFTRNSQALGLWRESFPSLSNPSSEHFSVRNLFLEFSRRSVSAFVASSINLSSGVRFVSSWKR